MSRKHRPMDVARLRYLLKKNQLRQSDLAWLCGVNDRTARSWCTGQTPIPQYADLLLCAYNQRLLSDEWFIKHIPSPIP